MEVADGKSNSATIATRKGRAPVRCACGREAVASPARLITVGRKPLCFRATAPRCCGGAHNGANASFWNDITPFTVRFDPIVYANPQARAATIMTATAFVEIAPEGWIAGGRECERCPFTKLCGWGCTAVPARDNGETNTQFAVEIADLAQGKATRSRSGRCRGQASHSPEHDQRSPPRTRSAAHRVRKRLGALEHSQGSTELGSRRHPRGDSGRGRRHREIHTVGDPIDRPAIKIA
jgi:hypothetical protein